MHAGHFLGQWNELIELAAVGVVVARQDVVDDVAVGGVLPEFVINHERGVLYGSIVNENKNATVLARLAVLRILHYGSPPFPILILLHYIKISGSLLEGYLKILP